MTPRRVGLLFSLFLVLVANQFVIQRWIWAQPAYRFKDRVNVPAAYQAGQFSNFFVAMAAFRNIAANRIVEITEGKNELAEKRYESRAR